MGKRAFVRAWGFLPAVGVLVPSRCSCPFGGNTQIDEDPPTTGSSDEANLFIRNSLVVSLLHDSCGSVMFCCLMLLTYFC